MARQAAGLKLRRLVRVVEWIKTFLMHFLRPAPLEARRGEVLRRKLYAQRVKVVHVLAESR